MELHECVFVLFGSTGDLAKKKLIPALYRLHAKSQLHSKTKIITIGRREYSDTRICKEYRPFIQKSIFKPKTWSEFCKRVKYHKLDFDDPDAYDDLLARVKKMSPNRLFYLATPPESFSTIVEHLARTGLASDDPLKGWHRVVFEKPFGSDLKSARNLNKDVTKLFREKQIYRIDHYIGKSIVQQILALRFANPILENQWDNEHIEAVEICTSETVNVGNRGGYYDSSGAIRDMVQNHLMQILSLVTMEPPLSLASEHIRDAKATALKHVALQSRAQLKHNLVLGQYTKGRAGGVSVPSYIDEEGISDDSRTETYAAVKLELNNKRWRGVPFYLWTGKALKERYAEVRVWFKPGNWLKIPDKKGYLLENEFVIRIQPEEGLRICFNLSDEEDDCTVEKKTMDFTRPALFGLNSREAYELLMDDVMQGDQTLFSRWDFVEQSWKITDNLRKGEHIVHRYKAGKEGPFAAIRLLKHRPHIMEK